MHTDKPVHESGNHGGRPGGRARRQPQRDHPGRPPHRVHQLPHDKLRRLRLPYPFWPNERLRVTRTATRSAVSAHSCSLLNFKFTSVPNSPHHLTLYLTSAAPPHHSMACACGAPRAAPVILPRRHRPSASRTLSIPVSTPSALRHLSPRADKSCCRQRPQLRLRQISDPRLSCGQRQNHLTIKPKHFGFVGACAQSSQRATGRDSRQTVSISSGRLPRNRS